MTSFEVFAFVKSLKDEENGHDNEAYTENPAKKEEEVRMHFLVNVIQILALNISLFNRK